MLAGSCFCYCLSSPVPSRTLDLGSAPSVLRISPALTIQFNVQVVPPGFTLNVPPLKPFMREELSSSGKAPAALSSKLHHLHPLHHPLLHNNTKTTKSLN